MAVIRTSVELAIDTGLASDPASLERAIAAEGRRAARELYLHVSRVTDDEATTASNGVRQRRESRWVATLFGRVQIARYRVRLDDATFQP